MFQSQPGVVEPLADFRIDGPPLRYSLFVPRLYGLCRELGMQPGRIMPSRAFCSDESQGYPIILMAKHFATFPFNHGQVGGVVATDRHGPHAHHGHDMVIVQASHVGYDPETATFGTYRRLQTEGHDSTPSCGKICGVVDWYQREYQFARDQVLIGRSDGGPVVIIDNLLLREDRDEGLMLAMPRIVRYDADGQPAYVRSLSTAKVFHMADRLAVRLAETLPPGAPATPIGDRLTPDLFYFRRHIQADEEGRDHLERNLIRFMPQIVTNPPRPWWQRRSTPRSSSTAPTAAWYGRRPTAASGCCSSPGSTSTSPPAADASSRSPSSCPGRPTGSGRTAAARPGSRTRPSSA